MAAYWLFDVYEVLDAAKLARYKDAVLATVRRHGGRYRLVGGTCEVVEGDWRPAFPVLIEFPTLEQGRSWYESGDYRDLRALRHAGAKCRAVLMQGDEDPLVS